MGVGSTRFYVTLKNSGRSR
ncbi:hypothetical protein [Escherichia coli]